MRHLLAQKPVATHRLNTASSSIATNAWTEVTSATSEPCDAIEIFNATGSILLLASGAAAAEVALPYTILPGGSSILVPFSVAKAARLSVKAVDLAASSGYVILNLFG